jgi:hypothetical protein
MARRVLGPTNRRVRVFVGLVLATLFSIQCLGPACNNEVSKIAVAIDKQETPEQRAARARQLAQTDHIALLEYCLEIHRQRAGDFRCTFLKQERIAGKVGPEQEMAVKFRRQPFSVAMAWTKNAPMGDRVLYIEGRYDNQMLVRPTNALARALVPVAVRAPDGEEALRTTLRPVNRFGLERSLVSILDVYKQAKAAGDLRAEVDQDADVLGRKTFVLVRYLPDGKDYPAYKTITYIDQELLLPIMIEGEGSRGEFLCRYLYKDLDFNVNWKDEDFTPAANGMPEPPKK